MTKGFVIDVKVIRKMLGIALKKRYDIDLNTFLADLTAGTARVKYPGCEDLAELTKYL